MTTSKIFDSINDCKDKLVTIITSTKKHTKDTYDILNFCYNKEAIFCLISEINDSMYYKEMIEHAHYVVILDELQDKLAYNHIFSKHSTEKKTIVDLYDSLTDEAKELVNYIQIKGE